jgi:D-alanyl-lipoteichoic acid acyltransferase DltB (MBOAT superfamily)
MDVTSLPFVLMAIAATFTFYAFNNKYKNAFLIILSLGFIGSFNLYLLVYILAYACINYFIGLKIPTVTWKKSLFRIGIVLNLLQLILLRYSSFAIDPILEVLNVDLQLSKLSTIIVPIGISYFTLQGIGYLVNVKMGWEKPESRFPDFLLYITFFPKFLSGPIERSNHLLPQLKAFKAFSPDDMIAGLRLILGGLFKKIIVANHLATAVAFTYANNDAVGGLNILLVILIQPLYLYFDFSGYTDIAIGVAKMFGIDLLPNFNRPFLSENVTTLWRRMHMSLSLWFNDYIFKQTSFRLRKWGKYAAVTAVFITFTLFGIWHGAGWTFMILGFLQAVAINYEFFTKRWRVALFSKMSESSRIWMGRILTYLFFGISHIFFFAPDLPTALASFSKFQNFGLFADDKVFHGPLYFGLTFALIFMIFEVIQNDYKQLYERLSSYWSAHRIIRYIVYYASTFLIVSQLAGNTSFIYEMF